MAVNRFDIATLTAAPWKNGGGSTREIVSQPQGAGIDGFDWRVSIASVAAAGPFSVFAGVDRVIVLLEGDGIHLRGDGVDHRLETPLAPFAFAGDVPLYCHLLGGTSTDFNLMTRRHRCRAGLQVLDAAGELAAATAGVLLAFGGAWHCASAGDEGERCAAGSGLWWRGAARAWQVTPAQPGGALVAVRIEPGDGER